MKNTSKFLALLIAFCMVLSLTALASGEASGGMAPPPGGGGSSEPDSYDAVLEITQDTELDGVDMASVNADENVIHVFDGATARITGSSFSNGGEGGGGDSASFYGVGATLFVSDGELYVDDVDIDSTVAGGAGVFAYKDGVAYVQNATIATASAAAGGLHVAGGGTLYAWDCDVVTQAPMAAAAIRSDRGGGTMVIDGGSYVTTGGTGAVYVTADISVHDAYLYTGGSEAIAIEGKNTIRLFDCQLEGDMIPGQINDNKVWNIIVYQSMSGDADVGTSHFEMVGGQLTTHGGPILYNTNTSSYITFKDVDIIRGDDTTYFLQVTGNSSSRTWGRAGANGANCIFSAYEQQLPGDVVYDTISNLDFYLLDGSVLEGAFRLNDTLNGGYSGDGIANVYIDAGSTWTVTGDSYINGTLACAGTIENATVEDFAGNVLYGDGEYTVLVGAFTDQVDVSAAGAVPVWEDYAVENPFRDASGEPSAAPSGEASGEASGAPAAPAAGGYSADEAGWKQYMKDYVSAVPAAQEHLDEYFAAIDAGEFYTMPGDMLFQDTFWGYSAATLDEFIAAGGNVAIPAFDPNLTAD